MDSSQDFLATRSPKSARVVSFEAKRISSIRKKMSIVSTVNSAMRNTFKIKLEEIEKLDCPISYNEDPSCYVIKEERIIDDDLNAEANANFPELSPLLRGTQASSNKFVIEIKAGSYKSMLTTFVHICNCIVRYTVLELPACFAILGIFNALIIIILIGLMSVISVFYLIKAHHVTGDT